MANILRDRLQMSANTEMRLLSVGKSKDTFKILFVKTTEDLKVGSLEVELSKDEVQAIITGLQEVLTKEIAQKESEAKSVYPTEPITANEG